MPVQVVKGTGDLGTSGTSTTIPFDCEGGNILGIFLGHRGGRENQELTYASSEPDLETHVGSGGGWHSHRAFWFQPAAGTNDIFWSADTAPISMAGLVLSGVDLNNPHDAVDTTSISLATSHSDDTPSEKNDLVVGFLNLTGSISSSFTATTGFKVSESQGASDAPLAIGYNLGSSPTTTIAWSWSSAVNGGNDHFNFNAAATATASPIFWFKNWEKIRGILQPRKGISLPPKQSILLPQGI